MAEEENNNSGPTASEIEAKKFGWAPKDEFKGDPEQWRDADEFLQRGREINGYLRNDLEKIQRKNQELSNELSQVRKVVGEFKEFHEKTQERAYARALEDLKQQKKAAIESSDGEAVVELDEKIDELKEQQQAEKKVSKVEAKEYDGVFEAWVSENPWVQTDKVLRATANGFSDEVALENPELVGTGRPFLDAVKKKMEEAFPEKFQNEARKTPAAVEGSTGSSQGSNRKKSYTDLPADAKAACDQFVKEKLLTREQYVADYFGE